MTASYNTSSSGSSVNPRMHQSSAQYSSESSSQGYSSDGYGADPVQQYARILYEHTRRQLDSASTAAAQDNHKEARQAHRSHHSRNGDSRAAALA